MRMQRNLFLTVLIVLMLVLMAAYAPAFAAKGAGHKGQGAGGGAGSGSGAGSGNGGPAAGGGGKKGDLYGDLYVILRDPLGVPILDGNRCVQPISSVTGLPFAMDYIDEKCEVPEGYEDETIEVEFGRLNIGRSPSKVLDQAYAEVIKNLDNATEIGLDPAGRIMMKLAGEQKTIDSPRENLALYRMIMLKGTLKTSASSLVDWKPGEGVIVHPSIDCLLDGGLGGNDLFHAAAFLGGAADKTGQIGVDLVIYLNTILGINSMSPVRYFNFSGFCYTRSERHVGEVTFIVRNGDGTYYDKIDSIMNAVFGGCEYSPQEPARDFAQAADDSRAIVDFVHTAVHDLTNSIQAFH